MSTAWAGSSPQEEGIVKRVRVLILTFGSRGDVQPYVALGTGLRKAGHEVVLAGHGRFKPFVESHGLIFRKLPGDPRRMLESPEGQAWVRSGRNGFQFMRYFVELARGTLPELLRVSRRVAQDADVIVFSQLSFAGYHIAEARGIPAVMASLQPFSPTRKFPPVGAVGPSGWGLWNLLGHYFTEYLLWLPFRKEVDRWRSAELGLPPLGWMPPAREARRRELPMIYGYSPSVLPPPDDWGESITVTGYWFLQDSDDCSPDRRLSEFLRSGEPPVYIGFGSMVRGEARELQRVAMRVADNLGCRVVLQRGWEQVEDLGGRPDLLTVGSLPHSWLFPRMSALVHHGGAGTTGAGLRAGIPSVLVPHFADQFFWGERIERLGAGPRPIPRGILSSDRLTAALSQARGSAPVRAAAAALGSRIRQERGVKRAVQAIERAARDFTW